MLLGTVSGTCNAITTCEYLVIDDRHYLKRFWDTHQIQVSEGSLLYSGVKDHCYTVEP